MHHKKILAAAVAGALGAVAADAALAQSEGVQIYGRLYPEFTVAKSSGATASGTTVSTIQKVTPTGEDLKTRNSVDSSNSRLGFRGKESLGGGLSAVFQIEQTVHIDGPSSKDFFATRNSFGGLEGGFGTVKLGNMDTVYKELGDPIRFMGIASGNFVSTSSIISKTGFGTSSASSFHLRQKNSVQYLSPRMGGVQLLAQYSPDEAKTGNLNAYLTSLGVRYDGGPVSVRLAHEIHNDFFGGSKNVPSAIANSTTGTGDIHSKDSATRLSVMYSFGQTRLAADLAQLKYTESGTITTGHFEEYKHTTWALVWEQRYGGPWRTTVAYASSAAGTCSLAGGVDCSTEGLDGKLLALGGEYSFSKRTALFVLAAKLQNGESATYNNFSQTPDSPDIPTGADSTQYAVGIRHNF